MGFVPVIKSLILFLYFRSCIISYGIMVVEDFPYEAMMMEDVVISTEDGPQLHADFGGSDAIISPIFGGQISIASHTKP